MIRAHAVPPPSRAAPIAGPILRSKTTREGPSLTWATPVALNEPPCPYCGVPIPRALRPTSQQVTCGAAACRRLKANATQRRSFKLRYARAKENGLCTACFRRRREPPEAGARPSTLCKKCHVIKLIKRIKYAAKLPERQRAQASAIALAELTHIEPIRKRRFSSMTVRSQIEAVPEMPDALRPTVSDVSEADNSPGPSQNRR
jgi:hypothetical protein